MKLNEMIRKEDIEFSPKGAFIGATAANVAIVGTAVVKGWTFLGTILTVAVVTPVVGAVVGYGVGTTENIIRRRKALENL